MSYCVAAHGVEWSSPPFPIWGFISTHRLTCLHARLDGVFLSFHCTPMFLEVRHYLFSSLWFPLRQTFRIFIPRCISFFEAVCFSNLGSIFFLPTTPALFTHATHERATGAFLIGISHGVIILLLKHLSSYQRTGTTFGTRLSYLTKSSVCTILKFWASVNIQFF